MCNAVMTHIQWILARRARIDGGPDEPNYITAWVRMGTCTLPYHYFINDKCLEIMTIFEQVMTLE